MAWNWKRLLWGKVRVAERNTVVATILVTTLLAWRFEDLLLIWPMGLAALLSWRYALLPLLLVGWYGPLQQRPSMLALGISLAVMVEGFRAQLGEQQALAHSRQELLKTLVHELRNPLFAAKGTIDNLALRFLHLEPRDLGLQLVMASDAMQTINQEVDDLTQLLRLETKALVARTAVVDLRTLYRSLARRYPAERRPKHTLVYGGGESLVVCDSLLLIQALDKLVSNALVHAPGGTVTVTAVEMGQRVFIEVQDEGPGIARENRATVFDRHKQLGADSIGFGLGLFLAKQYVEAQHGLLTLEDSSVGCCFRISLPRGYYEDQDSHC